MYARPSHTLILPIALIALWTSSQSAAQILNGRCYLLSPRTGLINADDNASRPAISTDAQQVAFQSRRIDNLLPSVQQVYVFNRTTNSPALLSSTTGLTANSGAGDSRYPALSADGRHAVFASVAPNFGISSGGIYAVDRDPDQNGVFDQTGPNQRRFLAISSSNAAAILGKCDQPCISASGRFVAFISASSQLVPGGVNTGYDVYLKDRDFDNDNIFDETATGQHKTVRISVNSAGQPANNVSNSARPAISASGRFIVYDSDATNLVSGDTNARRDVFLHDRDSDENGVFDEPGAIATTRVSVSSAGVQSDGVSLDASISADGRYVAFCSSASNLVPGLPAQTFPQIYLHDRITHETTLISRSTADAPVRGYCLGPRLSADGSRMVFFGGLSQLAADGAGGLSHVYVWDRNQPAPGLSRMLSGPPDDLNSLGETDPFISADGRLIAFASFSRGLGPDGAAIRRDAFLFDPTSCATPLAITSQPSDLTACQDQSTNTTFAVTAVGDPPIAFQWRKNDLPITGATSSQYTIPYTSIGTLGAYSVTVSHPCGAIVSASAALHLIAPPTVSIQPPSITTCAGATVTFQAAAVSPDAPVSYQWLRDSSPIPGATGPVLTLSQISSADAGLYSVQASTLCTSVTSPTSTLIISAPFSSNCLAWIRAAPPGSPPPRTRPSMVYDPIRRQSVMFGGITTSPDDSTWFWDGSNWQSRSPAVHPPQRSAFGMVYDAARDQIVLFGGLSPAGTPLSDIWLWNGSDWIEAIPVGPAPTARHEHAMAYDSLRHRVVMFGGKNSTSQTLSDTWEWDGTNWQPLTFATKPSARSNHAMAYDAARQKVVLYGGSSGGSETWEYDGAAWVLRAVPSPNSRTRHTMVFVDWQPATWMFGGFGAFNSSLYAWSLGGWSFAAPAQPPEPRWGNAMSYDSFRQRVIIFGGTNQSTNALLNETWEVVKQ